MTATTVTFVLEDGMITEVAERTESGNTRPLTDPLDIKDAVDRIANAPVAGGGEQGER